MMMMVAMVYYLSPPPPASPNLYVKALIPSVIVFGGRAFER